jgi:hypothetical protein
VKFLKNNPYFVVHIDFGIAKILMSYPNVSYKGFWGETLLLPKKNNILGHPLWDTPRRSVLAPVAKWIACRAATNATTKLRV